MNKNNPFFFKVAGLFNAREYDKEEYLIDTLVSFSDEELGFHIIEPLKGRIVMCRVERDIDVSLEELKTKSKLVCQRCLNPFIQDLEVKNKHYLFEKNPPKEFTELDDIYVINNRDLSIDITKPIFQELVLSIPVNIVCKKTCKGICGICGKDLNKGACACLPKKTKTTNNEQKPLKDLKKMFLLAKKRSID